MPRRKGASLSDQITALRGFVRAADREERGEPVRRRPLPEIREPRVRPIPPRAKGRR
jgi:hypothetical protein